MYTTKLVLSCLFLALCLSSCGGGSGGNSNPSAEITPIEQDDEGESIEGACVVIGTEIALAHEDSCTLTQSLFDQFGLSSQNIVAVGQELRCDDGVLRSTGLAIGGLTLNNLTISCEDDGLPEPPPAQNTPPVIEHGGDIQLDWGREISLPFNASDADGDHLNTRIIGLPVGLNWISTDTGILVEGEIPSSEEGQHQLTLSSDDGTDKVETTFMLTVLPWFNIAPEFISVNGNRIITAPIEFTMAEGEEFAIEVELNDRNNDSFSVLITDDSAQPDFLSTNLVGNIFTLEFSPSFVDAGSYSLRLQAFDGESTSFQTIVMNITQSYSGAISAISNGDFHSCALEQNQAHCWGLNSDNQTSELNQITNITAITAAGYFSCATNRTDVICAGDVSEGQDQIPEIEGDIIKLDAGQEHVCALTTEKLYCWGGQSDIVSNRRGQESVPQDLGPAIDVAAGHVHTCAIQSTGTVRCWGSNTYGESTPPALTFSPTNIDAGRGRSCATDGENITCWGNSEYYVVNPPPSNLSGLEELHIGSEGISCAVANESVTCWGDGGLDIDERYQLNRQAIPTTLGLVDSISVGDTHICAISENNIDCWGAGEVGESGDYDYGQSIVPPHLSSD